MYQPFKNLGALIEIKPNENLIKMRESVDKFLREVENGSPYSDDTIAILDDLKKARKGLIVNFINY